MFNFINKVNTILNLFHKSNYEMFFARVKMTTRNTLFIKNVELMELKATKIYRINRKRRLLEKC